MTQAELAAAIGVDESTVQNLESAMFGRGFSRMPGSAREAARYFGWTEDSVANILAGGHPTVAKPKIDASSAAVEELSRMIAAGEVPAGELPRRIANALTASGPLLDATIIELPGDDGEPEGEIVVIVKGKASASQEQLDHAVARWSQAERRLRSAPHDDIDPAPANGA
jgi:transcriptional regulator with XRE-family HTH domain